MDQEDIQLKCIDCHEFYIFGIGEQEYLKKIFDEKKISVLSAPKRCKKCRKERKVLNKNFAKSIMPPLPEFESYDELIRDLNKK